MCCQFFSEKCQKHKFVTHVYDNFISVYTALQHFTDWDNNDNYAKGYFVGLI